MIERIVPPGVPVPIAPYSPAVRAGGFIFVAGQVPLDVATGQMSLGDIAHETGVVLTNLRRVLEGCGASMADVVKVTVYLANAADFTGMNALYAKYFGEAKPVRTTVVVGFRNEIKVEIDCIAYVGQG